MTGLEFAGGKAIAVNLVMRLVELDLVVRETAELDPVKPARVDLVVAAWRPARLMFVARSAGLFY